MSSQKSRSSRVHASSFLMDLVTGSEGNKGEEHIKMVGWTGNISRASGSSLRSGSEQTALSVLDLKTSSSSSSKSKLSSSRLTCERMSSLSSRLASSLCIGVRTFRARLSVTKSLLRAIFSSSSRMISISRELFSSKMKSSSRMIWASSRKKIYLPRIISSCLSSRMTALFSFLSIVFPAVVANLNDANLLKMHFPICEATDYERFIPPFFECGGSPDWSYFIDLVHESWKQGIVTSELYHLSEEIIKIWDAKPYPPQDFHNLLCDPSKPWEPEKFYGSNYTIITKQGYYHKTPSSDTVSRSYMSDMKSPGATIARDIARDNLIRDILSNLYAQSKNLPENFFEVIPAEDGYLYSRLVEQRNRKNEKGNFVNLEGEENVDDNGEPTKYQPYCLYGFIYALIIRSRVYMIEGTAQQRKVAKSPIGSDSSSNATARQMVAAQNVDSHSQKIVAGENVEYVLSDHQLQLLKSAKDDLSYAVTCLGKEGSVDFLDTVPTGLSILDFYINILKINETDKDNTNETDKDNLDFLTYQEYIEKYPVPEPPPDEFGAIYYNPPPIPQWKFNRWFSNSFTSLSNSKDADDGNDNKIYVSVFGTHATLSMEPVHMVQEFVTPVVEPTYYGLEPRWCGILGMCNRGDAGFAKFYKDAEQDPYGDDFTWDKMVHIISEVYNRDPKLRKTDIVICTEPLVGCLLLQKLWRDKFILAGEEGKRAAEQHAKILASKDSNGNSKTSVTSQGTHPKGVNSQGDLIDKAILKGGRLPIVAYMGVALLNSVPPLDLQKFWELLDNRDNGKPEYSDTVLYVNNRILREQIYYQSGLRVPYVRAHGLYTEAVYAPSLEQILFWRAPLFVYPTLRCAVWQFLDQMVRQGDSYPYSVRFLDEKEAISYGEAGQHRAIVLLPWDHALMTFYELYSMGTPLFLPKIEWIYRFVYQRGQLSVGEPLYQTVHPKHKRPRVLFEEVEESKKETVGPMSPATGLSSAKAARGVAEDMLTRGLEENISEAEMKAYLVAALDLIRDMKYFLVAASNKTSEEDSYTSVGKVRRYTQANQEMLDVGRKIEYSDEPWHPYTPFQMSPRDSNEWNRMRKGSWWLRRGVRVDAMRYWFQFSDFYRFPNLQYFNSIPDLFCKLRTADLQWITNGMRKYNDETLIQSIQFWTDAVIRLLL